MGFMPDKEFSNDCRKIIDDSQYRLQICRVVLNIKYATEKGYLTCITVIKNTVMLSMVDIPRVIFSPDSAGIRNTNLILKVQGLNRINWNLIANVAKNLCKTAILFKHFTMIRTAFDHHFIADLNELSLHNKTYKANMLMSTAGWM